MAKPDSLLPPIQQRSPELKKIIEEIPRKLILGGTLILLVLAIMIFSIATTVSYPDIFEARIEITDCTTEMCNAQIQFSNNLPAKRDLNDLSLSLNSCEFTLIPLQAVARRQDQTYVAQISLDQASNCGMGPGYRTQGDLKTAKRTLTQRIWQKWTED